MKIINKEKYSFLENEKNNKNNVKINLNKCNYDKFLKGILSLKPPESFYKEEYV